MGALTFMLVPGASGIRGIQLRRTAASPVCPGAVPVESGNLTDVRASSRAIEPLSAPDAPALSAAEADICGRCA
ncbi:hypothetical protein Vau01_124920 [Virgisporangium aurantiacum]|uniref:Uncharacterized protein n=1 Tax=Virgisporangium aurantiacum TaxID=175570 RepID=A0A8J4E7V9_9ACTN|nr:hypothetical protein Vau01_124920 [Virgisporangium aurantiacum]